MSDTLNTNGPKSLFSIPTLRQVTDRILEGPVAIASHYDWSGNRLRFSHLLLRKEKNRLVVYGRERLPNTKGEHDLQEIGEVELNGLCAPGFTIAMTWTIEDPPFKAVHCPDWRQLELALREAHGVGLHGFERCHEEVEKFFRHRQLELDARMANYRLLPALRGSGDTA